MLGAISDCNPQAGPEQLRCVLSCMHMVARLDLFKKMEDELLIMKSHFDLALECDRTLVVEALCFGCHSSFWIRSIGRIAV